MQHTTDVAANQSDQESEDSQSEDNTYSLSKSSPANESADFERQFDRSDPPFLLNSGGQATSEYMSMTYSQHSNALSSGQISDAIFHRGELGSCLGMEEDGDGDLLHQNDYCQDDLSALSNPPDFQAQHDCRTREEQARVDVGDLFAEDEGTAGRSWWGEEVGSAEDSNDGYVCMWPRTES